MTAPAAPAIYAHFDGSRVRLRWAPVPTATDYNVYVGQTSPPTTLTKNVLASAVGSDGWNVTLFMLDEVPEYIAVTARNVGAEESSKSNEYRVDNFGGTDGTSFPPTGPRGPYRTPFG